MGRAGRGRKDKPSVIEGQRQVPRSQLREPGFWAGEKQGPKGPSYGPPMDCTVILLLARRGRWCPREMEIAEGRG